MENKSLYTVLGIRPEASQDQIEAAYAAILEQLKEGTNPNPNADDRVRLIAAKEAYEILSNPVRRQQYNQKIFAPQTVDVPQAIVIEQAETWTISKVLVVGLIVLAAIGVYGYTTTQREQLRLAHEKEVADAQARLEQERLEQQKAMMAQQAERERQAADQALRDQAIRESDAISMRLRQEAMEKQRQEQYQQMRDDAARRQQLAEAQQRALREKQTLQWVENENRRNRRY
ncbi:MAG: DnaJ domain-containing protein [Rhizobium sp.]|nr:DnaJ domain-containing protein [Rhizobium sp.]